MVTKLKYILIIITSFMFIQGCVNIIWHVTHLSHDDLQWVVGAVRKHPKAHFISSNGTVSQLYYTNLEHDDPIDADRIQCSSSGHSEHLGFAKYEYEIKQADSLLNGYFSIGKLVNDSIEFQMELGTSKSWLTSAGWYDEGNRFNPHSERIKTINGYVIVKDCITCDTINTEYNDYGKIPGYNKIVKFIISKEYGLLYYEFESGEYFVRQFD